MKVSTFITIQILTCFSSSLSHSRRESIDVVTRRSLKMDKGNQSESMGMGMSAEKGGIGSMIESSMAMGMGMGMEMGMGMGRATLEPTISPTRSSSTNQPTAAATFDENAATPNVVPQPIDSASTTTNMPTEAPILNNVVRVSDHFISFVAPLATRGPTREEYDEMIERIKNWFEVAISTEYNNQNIKLLDVHIVNDFEVYGVDMSIPPRPEDFNIYINFNYADYLFEGGGGIVSEQQQLPSPADLFKVIRRSITTDFILDAVRTYTGTPFESTNEVFLAALKA